MSINMINFLLLLCCYPSLSAAWCSGGGIAGGVVGVASKQYQSSRPIHQCHLPREPFAKKHSLPQLIHQRRHHDVDGVKLWSVANGGGQEVEETPNDDGGKMTLKKASKLLATFWEMAYPYYQESQPGRRLFYGMILLTLMNSG